jgi:hypothetical protein
MSTEISPNAGPSRLSATVADESEELAAENGGVVLPSTNGEVGDVEMNGNSNGNGDVPKKEEEEEEEEEDDPTKIPKGACETLYIQNLNEKVQIPGMLPPVSSLSLLRNSRS